MCNQPAPEPGRDDGFGPRLEERITKVVKQVAKDLLVNDEGEISEVLRLRLFDHVGKESVRKTVALAYANWSPGPEAEFPPRKHEDEEAPARTLVLSGSIPPESWNKVGTRLIPKLRSGNQLSVGVTFSVQVDAAQATYLLRELQQILADLNLTDKVKVETR